MAIVNRNVTILVATAKLIATTGFGDPVELFNIGPGNLYIGGSNAVTNVNGFKVNVTPNYGCTIQLKDNAGQVWGYADGGAVDVRVLEAVSG